MDITHSLLRLLNEEVINSNGTDTTSLNSTGLITKEQMWGVGIATSIGYLIISFLLTSIIIMCYFCKKISKKFLSSMTNSLIALAIGSLLGDSIIHIIPDLYGEREEGEEKPNPNICSLMILVGFFTFFSLEKIFYIAGCGHSHGSHDDEDEEDEGHDHMEHREKREHKHKEHTDLEGHNHKKHEGHNHEDHDHKCHDHADHSHQNHQQHEKLNNYENVKINSVENLKEDEDNLDEDVKRIEIQEQEMKISVPKEVKILASQSEALEIIIIDQEVRKTTNNLEIEVIKEISKENIFSLKGKKTAGYLILISSCIHNVMDGIAVGISFATRKSSIIVATNIAILLHEIPKELGDAGILLNSKFSPWSVLFWNIAINITSIIGTIVGLGIGEISAVSEAYSIGFVAGNFFYIALSEMVPEIVKKKGVWNHISQFFFLLLGIGIMFLIILYESNSESSE